MHIFPSLLILPLTRSSSIIPPHILFPSDPSLPNNLTLNATTLSREPWPRVPWTYTIDEELSIAIEYYGRSVCAGDSHCEERVLDSINEVVRIVDEEYVMSHGEENSFASDGVNFWIRQEMMTPRVLVEELVATLRWFMVQCGTREVTHAGLINYGQPAAVFELTFPGVEKGVSV